MNTVKSIEVSVLFPDQIADSETMLVAAARLTQRAHNIQNMHDFKELLARPYNDTLVETLVALPHPTIQKFGVINIAIVGASRRFLAQITRHQNEVKFMSGSLQYSDYSGVAGFVVPYDITRLDAGHLGNAAYADNYHTTQYLNSCAGSMSDYSKAIEQGVDSDAAGYMAPQGLRNVLIMSATPYQFKHMIRQRVCNRNTLETQYVMLLIWEALMAINSTMFYDCAPGCVLGHCAEGSMCCGKPLCSSHPTDILNANFALLRGDK